MRLRVLPTIRHKYLDTVAHTALSVARRAAPPVRRRPHLQRRQRAVRARPAARRRQGRAQRRRPRVAARQVERGSGAGTTRPAPGWRRSCRSSSSPTPRSSPAGTASGTASRRSTSRTAATPGACRRARRSRGSASSRAATSSTSAGSSPRTTPTRSSRPIAGPAGWPALGVPLVVVGDAPYATDYKAAPRGARPRRRPACMLTGYVFGDGYAELQSNALAYVQATEVGGTHPALVEAMGRGACDRRQRRARASRGPGRRRALLRPQRSGRPGRALADLVADDVGAGRARGRGRGRARQRPSRGTT